MQLSLRSLRLNHWFGSAALSAALFLSGQAIAQGQPAATPTPTPAGQPNTAPTPAGQPEGGNLGDQIKNADAPTLVKFSASAEQLIDAGRFEEALVVYGALLQRLNELKATPELQQNLQEAMALEANLYTGQGRALAGLQEYPSALEMFKTALETQNDSNYPPTLVARGEMYLDLNAPSQAQPDFEKAVQARRDFWRAVFDLGKAHVLQGHYEDGLKTLNRFLQTGDNPFTAEAYRLRGMANSGLYKFEPALADMHKSIEIDPENHETYFQLGVIQIRQEDFTAAADSLGMAISKYKPKRGHEEEIYFEGPMVRASAHIEVGKHATDEATRMAAYQAAVDEAQRVLAKFDEKSPYTAAQRSAALVARGIGERMLGRMGDAIRTFSQAIELNPQLSEAFFRRGICLQQIGENRMAVNDFTQAAILNYEDPRGNLWEGFVYAKLGNYHEAIRAYGDAIAASDRYTPAYVNRGLAYMQLGDNQKAINDFNDALRIEPTNGDYYFKRGVAYIRNNELNKASESLASAINFDPAHREAYRYLADVVQKQGHADLAAEYRRKAADLEKKPASGGENLEKSATPR